MKESTIIKMCGGIAITIGAGMLIYALLPGAITIGAGMLISTLLPGKKSEPNKYSLEWIKSLNDDEWANEREKLRLKRYDKELSIREQDWAYDLLILFDKVKSDRDYGERKPCVPRSPREHGYNLYKDD